MTDTLDVMRLQTETIRGLAEKIRSLESEVARRSAVAGAAMSDEELLRVYNDAFRQYLDRHPKSNGMDAAVAGLRAVLGQR